MESTKDLIQCPNEALIDPDVLKKLAIITEDDIDSAIKNWEVFLKDDEFENILEADD